MNLIKIKDFIEKGTQDNLNLEYFLNEIARLIGTEYELDRCVIATYDEDNNLVYPYNNSLNEDQSASKYCSQYIKQIDKNIFIDDIKISKINISQEFRDELEHNHIKSLGILALKHNNKTRGALLLHKVKDYKKWSDKDISTLEEISRSIANIINHSNFKLNVPNQREILLEKIISIIANSYDINETLQKICEEIAKVFKAEIVTITECPDKNNLKNQIKWAEYFDFNVMQYSNIPPIDERVDEFWGKNIVEEGKTLVIHDIVESDLPDYVKETYKHIGGKSFLVLPIKSEHNNWGGIALTYILNNHHWTETEIKLLKSITKQIYMAIKHAKLYEEVINRSKHEKLLNKVLTAIRRTIDIEEMKTLIVNELGQVLGATRSFIMEYDHNTGKFLSVKNEYLEPTDYKSCIGLLGGDFPELELLAKNKEELIVTNVEKFIVENKLKNTSTEEHFKEYQIESGFSLPIFNEDQLIGNLVIHYCTKEKTFFSEDIELVRVMANQIGIALNQSSLYSTIKKQAERESLLRADDSILINKNLAGYLGINCALTYQTVKNIYDSLKYSGNFLANDFVETNIEDLYAKTFLPEFELVTSLDKLSDFKLIDYSFKTNKNIIFKVVENENLLVDLIMESLNSTTTGDCSQIQPIEKSILPVSELLNIYGKVFLDTTIEAVKFLLLHGRNKNSINQVKVSNLVFLVLCKTFDKFIKQHNLNLASIKNIISEGFIHSNKKKNKNTLSFGVSNKLLISRLKKLLAYRFHEANLTASDFSSKIDLYSNIHIGLDEEDL